MACNIRGSERRADRDAALRADNVVDFKRLVDLGEPFGPISRPPSAMFVQGQLELAEQARHLFPRRHVTEIRAGAEGSFVDVVERGKSPREKLAIDHPFGEAVDRAEAKPERKFLQAVCNQLLVAR